MYNITLATNFSKIIIARDILSSRPVFLSCCRCWLTSGLPCASPFSQSYSLPTDVNSVIQILCWLSDHLHWPLFLLQPFTAHSTATFSGPIMAPSSRHACSTSLILIAIEFFHPSSFYNHFVLRLIKGIHFTTSIPCRHHYLKHVWLDGVILCISLMSLQFLAKYIHV